MQPAIFPVPVGRPSFLEAARCDDLDTLEADVAIIAIPYNTPYDLVRSRAPSSRAPGTLREQSLRWSSRLDHYDFEFGGPLLGAL